MKRTALVLTFILFAFTLAFADSKIIKEEVAGLKAMLPINQNGLTLTDIRYYPKRGMLYTYIIESKGKTKEELKAAITPTKEKTINNLCEAVPSYIQDELINDGTPMVYNFYNESNFLIDSIEIDFLKCVKTGTRK